MMVAVNTGFGTRAMGLPMMGKSTLQSESLSLWSSFDQHAAFQPNERRPWP